MYITLVVLKVIRICFCNLCLFFGISLSALRFCFSNYFLHFIIIFYRVFLTSLNLHLFSIFYFYSLVLDFITKLSVCSPLWLTSIHAFFVKLGYVIQILLFSCSAAYSVIICYWFVDQINSFYAISMSILVFCSIFKLILFGVYHYFFIFLIMIRVLCIFVCIVK